MVWLRTRDFGGSLKVPLGNPAPFLVLVVLAGMVSALSCSILLCEALRITRWKCPTRLHFGLGFPVYKLYVHRRST